MSLERLLRPRSIAVIGGGAWCEAVVAQCKKIGFDGPVWPVHPTRVTVAGIAAFRDIEDLPEPPDAVFIGVNRHATIGLVSQLRHSGAGGAVCFASGFLEVADGVELSAELREAAGDMPILGPNCYGILNALDGAALWPDQHGLTRVQSGVAIITQSSNIAINLTMQKRGLPIAYMVTAGNQLQQNIASIAQALCRDPRITAIGLYVESFSDIEALEAFAATAQRLDKPVVVLKAGRSEETQRATISHTASLAGSEAGSSALMRRLGIAQVRSLSALLETLKIFHCHGWLEGPRIASLSCSGGEASIVADAALPHGLSFPALDDRQKERLAAQLSAQVSLTNPLDYHTDIWRNQAAMSEVFATMSGPDIAMTLIVLDFPRADICDATDWQPALDAVKSAATRTGRPYALLASLVENLPEPVAAELMQSGITPLCGIESAMEAIAAATRSTPATQPMLITSQPAKGALLGEWQAKRALAQYGMSVPKGRLVSTAEAPRAAAEIGFPVVLKAQGLAHKSDHDAVRLNLSCCDEVAAAAQDLPGDNLLIEEMVTGNVELLIGVTYDAPHGYLLTIGAGGTLTELLEDRAHLMVPATEDEIDAAISTLRIASMIDGYRGKAGVSRATIAQAVLSVQDYVTTHAGKLSEIEINPLICNQTQAVAADALIVTETDTP